ncbi:MAG TPA: cryptochrome/photolyase family protein [Lacibacter sp.]|nr:cryptochrome/photolyase family protein [Lacibacter sp.]HMO87655.1 cryptochrome/photolyase family protein [Lacibacter sp.]HMP86949.1 cryptochrome/photolyase family protein [Lacibacter sp.]
MKSVALIFPHQLFEQHPALQRGMPVYLVEEQLFFRQYAFHQQKIVLHRASMKAYGHYLLKKKLPVTYVESSRPESDVRMLMKQLVGQGVQHVLFADVADNWLRRRLQQAARRYGVQLKEFPTPNFLNSPAETDAFFNKRKTYFQTDFYIWQRKQRNILLEANQQPAGGKWTYDADNRQKFPKNEQVPDLWFPEPNAWVQEAIRYTEQHFGAHYGKAQPFRYPVTFADAQRWLRLFLEERFHKFGVYEDAMVARESFLYHSVLTPMLNIGLLSPQQILHDALEVAVERNIPLNSVEGFVRQIIGWREFIRLVYEREGSRQRTTNYWGFTRKIPASFWNGTTGIEPVDLVIRKVLDTGYCHHIERLMVLGNFMLLCEFDPDEVYRWFMELFVDAYDWVMVPNVYGMTQFADGGLMTTKPYISGSNYLLKMGDWKKGDWCATWDGLFWRFMHVHRDFFGSNPRLGMLLKTFDKMPEAKKQQHLQEADRFLSSLG